MRLVALDLTHPQFLRLGPSLGPDGRLLPLRAVSRVADPLVWTAFASPDAAPELLLRPGCLVPTDDDHPRPIGYVVCSVPWDDDDASARYLPPPPTPDPEPTPPSIPDHIRNPPTPPAPPTARRAAAAPMRPFHPPPKPKDIEKRKALEEIYQRAVERERRRYEQATEEVSRHPSILDEARRRARVAEAGQAAVPPNLAPHIRFLSLRDDGTAVFLVRTPTFRASLRIHQATILRSLNQAGFDATRVEARVGAFPEDLLATPERSASSSPRSAQTLRQSALTVEDAALREQLLRLADAIEGKGKPPPTS